MANTKISALTSATTPLAGTEVIPVVQSGATVKATVQDVLSSTQPSGTANGVMRLNASKVTTTGTNLTYDGTTLKLVNAAPVLSLQGTTGTGYTSTIGIYGGNSDTMQIMTKTFFANADSHTFRNAATTTTYMQINAASNVIVSAGNLQIGTAARGVDFSANTPAAGKTSTLFNWYEEGTWTPAQGGGLTVVGAFSSTGRYTRNGRQVFVNGTITGATSVAIAAAGVLTTNLPFTVNANGAGHGNITNAANTAFAAVVCTSTNITAAGAVAATGTITFSATYIV